MRAADSHAPESLWTTDCFPVLWSKERILTYFASVCTIQFISNHIILINCFSLSFFQIGHGMVGEGWVYFSEQFRAVAVPCEIFFNHFPFFPSLSLPFFGLTSSLQLGARNMSKLRGQGRLMFNWLWVATPNALLAPLVCNLRVGRDLCYVWLTVFVSIIKGENHHSLKAFWWRGDSRNQAERCLQDNSLKCGSLLINLDGSEIEQSIMKYVPCVRVKNLLVLCHKHWLVLCKEDYICKLLFLTVFIEWMTGGGRRVNWAPLWSTGKIKFFSSVCVLFGLDQNVLSLAS